MNSDIHMTNNPAYQVRLDFWYLVPSVRDRAGVDILEQIINKIIYIAKIRIVCSWKHLHVCFYATLNVRLFAWTICYSYHAQPYQCGMEYICCRSVLKFISPSYEWVDWFVIQSGVWRMCMPTLYLLCTTDSHRAIYYNTYMFMCAFVMQTPMIWCIPIFP